MMKNKCIYFFSFLLILGFAMSLSPSVIEAAPKIQTVRAAAQPDNASGEKVWRYVMDFSEPVKRKPEVRGNVIFLHGVDLKAQQGKVFNQGSVPKMEIGTTNGVVTLTLFPGASQNLEYKVFALAADPKTGKKERIVVEITDRKGGKTSGNENTGTTVVSSNVKSAHFNQGGYSVQRITVDLKSLGSNSYVITDSDSASVKVTIPNSGISVKDQSHSVNGDSVSKVRVVNNGSNTEIHLSMATYFRKSDVAATVTKGANGQIQIDVRQKLPDYQYSLTPGIKGKIIAIDPGHGGSDPGAVGPTGVREKTVTLGIAQKLGAKLKNAGAIVVFSRTTDVDVARASASATEELHKRVESAHNGKADILISIHADAAAAASAGGTTVYFTSKTRYDQTLASSILPRVISAGGLQNRGTREAGFYVTKKAWIPAVLIETAFISNPTEEKLLYQDAWQDKFASGIYYGVVDYFKNVGGK